LADRYMHPPPRGVRVENTMLGGVKGDWLIPDGAPENPVIVFYHGGGILFGWSGAFRRMLGYVAQFARLRAIGVDYRLMPDHRYRAAHDDCFAVYKTLVEQGKTVVLMGESSGGVLALATLLRLKAAGMPQPSLCVLVSPTVDYGFRDDRIWHSDDIFIDPKFVVEQHKHYTAGQDMMQPDLAPIDHDLSGIAPLYVMAGEREVLWGESLRLKEAAGKYHVPAEFVFLPDLWHGWTVLVPQLPEATESLKMVGARIHEVLSL
jgi:epsilon-lactone hydrolase